MQLYQRLGRKSVVTLWQQNRCYIRIFDVDTHELTNIESSRVGITAKFTVIFKGIKYYINIPSNVALVLE